MWCTTSPPSLLHIQVDFDNSGTVDLTECYAMVLNVYLKIALWVTLCEYGPEVHACVQTFLREALADICRAYLTVAITSHHATCADTVPTQEDVKKLYNSVGVMSQLVSRASISACLNLPLCHRWTPTMTRSSVSTSSRSWPSRSWKTSLDGEWREITLH